MLICPKCGKNSEEKEFFEAFCVDCYPFKVKLPKNLKLDKCKRCERMRLKGEWQQYDKKKIEEWVASKCRGEYESCVYSLESRTASFRFRKDDKEVTIKRPIEQSSMVSRTNKCSRSCSGTDRVPDIHGTLRRSIGNLELETLDTICRDCSRISGGYYEAIIQLRGDADKVERKAQKLGTELGRKTFISKWEEMHGGLDLYVGSTRVVFETLQKVGLKPSKISKKLTGRREGKKMYRTTFAVRV